MLENEQVSLKEVNSFFSRQLSQTLISTWRKKNVIISKKNKLQRGIMLSLGRNIFLDTLIKEGVNSASYNYLTSLNTIGYNDIVGLRYKNKSGHLCDIFRWNTLIDAKFAKAIAVIIAESGLDVSRIVVQNKSPEIISIIENFCIKYSLAWRKGITKKGLTEISIYKAGTILKILEDIFEVPRLDSKKSASVKVPNAIMGAGEEVLSSYLST